MPYYRSGIAPNYQPTDYFAGQNSFTGPGGGDNIPTFQGAGWVNQDRPDFASIDTRGQGSAYVGYSQSPQLFNVQPQAPVDPNQAAAVRLQQAYSGQPNYGPGMAPVMPGMQMAQQQANPQMAANSNLASYLTQKYLNQPGGNLDMDAAVQGIQSDPVLSQLGGVQRMATITSALGQSPQAYAATQLTMQQKRAELATALLGQQKSALDLQQSQQSFPVGLQQKYADQASAIAKGINPDTTQEDIIQSFNMDPNNPNTIYIRPSIVADPSMPGQFIPKPAQRIAVDPNTIRALAAARGQAGLGTSIPGLMGDQQKAEWQALEYRAAIQQAQNTHSAIGQGGQQQQSGPMIGDLRMMEANTPAYSPSQGGVVNPAFLASKIAAQKAAQAAFYNRFNQSSDDFSGAWPMQ